MMRRFWKGISSREESVTVFQFNLAGLKVRFLDQNENKQKL